MRSGGTGAAAVGRRRGSVAFAALCLSAALSLASPARSNTYTVTTNGDDSGLVPCTGAGTSFTCNTLRDAITTSNGAGGSNTINFASTIGAVTLLSSLNAINTSANTLTTIDGSTSNSGSVTINAAAHGAFFVATQSASFKNLTVFTGSAVGGSGATSGGGGGLGAGGGLFVASGAIVTTSGVVFSSDSASGGAGGSGAASTGGGSGGGLNGAGGGGGGSLIGAGGAGGFGGGGGGGNGGSGGAGGFGAGGGGGTSGGLGGFAAGNGGGSSQNGGGGGGAALGGAIFVQQGGSLTLDGALTINGSSVTAGAGGSGGQSGGSGQAFGSGIFLNGSGTLSFAPGSGQSQTVADAIADQTGSGGGGTNAGTWGIVQSGPGTLTLGGANTYTGGTALNQGTLSISANNNLGASSGALALAAGTTLGVTGSFTFNHAVTIGGSTSIDVSGGQNVTVSSIIADGGSPGTLTKTNTGTLTLTGVNTYTGATTINGGTLALGGGGSIATSSGINLASALTAFDISGTASTPTIQGLSGVFGGTVSLGGNTLNVNQAGNTTFAGGIADGGSAGGKGGALAKTGSGTLTLSGINTYTGATTIGGGTLALSGLASITASSGVTLTASGAAFDVSGLAGLGVIQGLAGVAGSVVALGANQLTVNQSGSAIFAGVVSGGATSTLSFGGSGTETLSGVSTMTGDIILTAGTLALGAGGSIASASVLNLAASGTVFDISAAGSQTIQGLSGVSGSAVTLGSNTLTLGNASTSFFAGVFSGTGGITKQGTGTLALSAVNTYTGATTVGGGTLALFPGGSIAASSGVNLATAGAGFDLSAGGNQTIRDLSGVSGSTLITGLNTLSFGTSNSTSFAGSFAGFGGLVKQGAGTLTLTGDSSAFSGTTTVTGGGVLIGPTPGSGGVLGGSVQLQNGAFVAGHGTIRGALSNVSGIVASLGAAVPLSVGSFTQSAGGTLLVGLSPTAATRLAVAGSASLAGTLDIEATPTTGFVPFSRFTILNAGGGVSGTFNQVTGNFPELPFTVQYLSQAVNLVLGGFTGATGNETAVANSLNAALPNATGDFATVLDIAVKLPANQMRQALSSFGGQIYGNLAELSLEDRRLFLGAMDERLRLLVADSPSAAMLGSLGGAGFGNGWGGRGNALQLAALSEAINDPVGIAVDGMNGPPSPPLAPEPAAPVAAPAPLYRTAAPPLYAPTYAPATDAIGDPVGVAASRLPAAPEPSPLSGFGLASGNLWARAFGQFGSFSNSTTALGSDYTTGGGAIGADLIHSRDRLFGVAVGGGRSSVSLNTNPETGTISFFQGGVYGAQAIGYDMAVDGAAIYAHDTYDVSRGIFLPGLSRTATSSHDGNDAVIDVGISRPYLAGGWQVTPRAGLSYYHIDQASFSESGANTLDLAVTPNALDALFSRIGVAFARPLTWGDTRVVPELRAAWLHNFLDATGAYNASFIGANAASFAQTGVPLDNDAVDLGIGLGFAIPQTAVAGEMSGFLQFDATLGSRATISSVAGGLRYRW